ncbi:MAG: SDR family NAD(P)-dependent oxidoreductase [Rhodospirillaceae bacterium]|nr:SDR family NAD(P)-dependent oxidoreductase [Rhodospirillaceae bacterium]
MTQKLWWITGGGSGIGRALAQSVAADGHKVVITGRRVQALEETASVSNNIFIQQADVTDASGLATIVAEIEARHGPIDVAILNAAQYQPMDLADFDARLFSQTINTNILGVANCLDPLLKRMAARRAGQIAVIASVAGYRGLPKAAAYGPSKAALINMVEALKPSADAAGIKLQLINPGFVETPMTEGNAFPMPFLMKSDEAVRQIRRGLDSQRFEIAFPWRFVLLLKLGRLLPARFYFAITRRMIGK